MTPARPTSRARPQATPGVPADPWRRQLCAAPLAALATTAWPGGARGQAAEATRPAAPAEPAAAAEPGSAGSLPLPAPDPARLALVIGNRRYPEPFDLPSIHTNARDVHQALRQRGFNSTLVLDADPAQARRVVDTFVAQAQAAPADATVFFYFSGHGLQLEAENLLLASGVRPDAAADSLLGGSLTLGRDVVQRLPHRPAGLTVAVVDACRTDLRPNPRGADGLNQVEAPPGCLIAFSTGAGKPAIAPKRETETTFYTGALVEQLSHAPDELSFSDLFRLVKIEVQRTMLNHRFEVIKKFAQFPFIAENTNGVFPVAAPAQLAAARQRASREDAERQRREREAEDRDWAELQAAVWPPDLLRLASEFQQRWRASAHTGAAVVAAEGAREAAAILRRNDVRLYRGSFEPVASRGAAYNSDLRKAARGDKDAAARIGRQWATPAQAGPGPSRFEGWMQFAAELGNGIASYELALHYRRSDQPEPAARWEARARALGYTPPPTLEHYRK